MPETSCGGGLLLCSTGPDHLGETHQEAEPHASLEMLKGKMHFLLPGERYDLPAGDFSLLDRVARGDAVPLMPGYNAYGLQGTKFLDPLSVPRATVRGRSWMTAEPPYETSRQMNPRSLMPRTRKRKAQQSRACGT